jgi:hypothetical protein
MDLERMSGPKLMALHERRGAVVSDLTRELIAAGFGQERGSETRERAKAGDPLAQRWVEAQDSVQAIYDELDARRRYHGSNKPIKRRA